MGGLSLTYTLCAVAQVRSRAADSPLVNSIASIARSGLDAARLQLDQSARGIANAQASNSRSQAPAQAREAQVHAEGPAVNAPTAGATLADNLISQKTALYAFKANLRTLQTQDQMLGTLLDLRA
jgi:flagellar basal body rod protein FlgC